MSTIPIPLGSAVSFSQGKRSTRTHANMPPLVVVACIVLLSSGSLRGKDPSNPLSAQTQSRLNEKFDKQIAEQSRLLKESPQEMTALSRRGDAYFFRGRFAEAVRDYDAMLVIDPSLKASHWRRGIALFYAGKHAEGAKQFEAYETFDNVDRENGIWRYFCQYRANGKAAAQKSLLKYQKDDREPFPAVYGMFEGKVTSDQMFQQIREARISPDEREKRFFYAHLYAGLNEALEGRDARATEHLRLAVSNTWGPKAGYGPNYMWHVGRLHLDILIAKGMKKDKR